MRIAHVIIAGVCICAGVGIGYYVGRRASRSPEELAEQVIHGTPDEADAAAATIIKDADNAFAVLAGMFTDYRGWGPVPLDRKVLAAETIRGSWMFRGLLPHLAMGSCLNQGRAARHACIEALRDLSEQQIPSSMSILVRSLHEEKDSEILAAKREVLERLLFGAEVDDDVRNMGTAEFEEKCRRALLAKATPRT